MRVVLLNVLEKGIIHKNVILLPYGKLKKGSIGPLSKAWYKILKICIDHPLQRKRSYTSLMTDL